MIICAFENSPSIPSFLVTNIVYIGYGQLKKWLLFLLPFNSCPPWICISYCCLCQCQAVCYYYMPVPTKYHWNISFQKKMFIEICCKKFQKCKNLCDNPFLLNFKGLSKKIKYIHQNLRYYETIEQIHFLVVKKIESYAWEKNCNIWTSRIPPPSFY